MNVLFITHYTELYGANRSLLNLINGLSFYNINPIVLTREQGDLTKELNSRNITTISHNFDYDFILKDHCKGYKGLQKRIYVLRKNRFAAKKILVKLSEHNIDLVYTNSSVIFIGFFLSRYLKVPHIWHIREFGELHYNLVPNVGNRIFKYMLGQTDATVFVSHCLQTYYSQNKRVNSNVVYNGVASKDFMLKFKNRQVLALSEYFTFCLVGLIDKNKGQLDAIKAFELLGKEYPSTKLILAGGGDRSSLENYVIKNSIKNVEFLGEVKDPFAVYLNSHVSLMCSKNEAMGRVTVESMCCKTPVIGVNNTGTKELITHNENGLLYDGSVEDLAEKMRIILLDVNLRKALAQTAYEFALDKFTEEAYSSQVYKVLTKVAN